MGNVTSALLFESSATRAFNSISLIYSVRKKERYCMNTTAPTINRPINDLLRCALIFIPFVLICVALLPGTQAVNPPPDGGYPGGNSAEGQNALFGLSSG